MSDQPHKDARVNEADKGGLVWASIAIASATLFLALFNAESARSWTAELSPTPDTVVLRQAASGWKGFTDRVGLDAPRAAVRAAWTAATEARWSEPRPGPSDQR
jgi:hypothetical protein